MTRTVRTARLAAVSILGSPFFIAVVGGALLSILGWAALTFLS